MNLGYACINMTLGKQKPKATTNRSMIKRTFLEKGIGYANELSLQNARDLFTILQWNNRNNIKCFRLSSDIFPWGFQSMVLKIHHTTNELKQSSSFVDIMLTRMI